MKSDLGNARSAEQARRQGATISVAAAIAANPEPVVLVGLDGRILLANPAFARAVGAQGDDLIGLDAFTLEVKACRRAPLEQVIATREPVFFEDCGQPFAHWYLPVFGAAGELDAVMVVTRDITERARAPEAIRTSEKRFRSIFENANVGIASTDVTGRVIEFNDVFVSMLGYSPEALRSMSFADITHPDDLAVESVFFAEVLANERDRYRMEKRYVARDGRHLWVDIFVSALRDDEGRVTTFVAVIADITARKLAEAGLREKEAQLSAVFENISEGLMLIAADADGTFRVATVNQFLGKMLVRAGFEVAPDRWVGCSLEEVARSMGLSDDQMTSRIARIRRVLETGESVSVEATLSSPLRNNHFQTTVTPIFDDAGRATYVLWTARDVTDERDAEAALRASLAEKETLLREIHHRVRNNLQVVSSLLSLQGNSVDDPRQQAAFQESKDRIRTMALVHERLYRSSNFAAIDFCAHIGDLARMIASAQPDRAELAVLSDSGPIHVSMQVAIPLGLIVNELVTNAFKHAYAVGTRGRIVVSCRHAEGVLRITVSDAGKGLPADFHFESSRSLGLKLVRSLAEQIHANVDIRSAAGTTVTIAVPTSRTTP